MLTLLAFSGTPRSLISSRMLGMTSVALGLGLFQPQMAYASASHPGAAIQEDDLNTETANTPPDEPELATELPSEVKEQHQAEPSVTFVSEGTQIALESLGINITPPASWEVSTNTGTLSVVMREPRNPAPSYDKAKYQRNITVAAIHQASPIDEKRAAELKEEMTAKFSQDSLVSEYQILEHKFFNYRGTNDGLLLFSSLKIGEYPMMQMHVLVSGQDKQFLMTYTDLADQFQDQANGTYDQAWQTMTSIEVSGETPSRHDQYLRYGAFAGGFLLLGLTGVLIRRKAARFDFGAEADALDSEGGDYFSSDEAEFYASERETRKKTTAQNPKKAQKAEKADDLEMDNSDLAAFGLTEQAGWKLAAGDSFSSEFDEFSFSSEAPKTKKTSYVSSF